MADSWGAYRAAQPLKDDAACALAIAVDILEQDGEIVIPDWAQPLLARYREANATVIAAIPDEALRIQSKRIAGIA